VTRWASGGPTLPVAAGVPSVAGSRCGGGVAERLGVDKRFGVSGTRNPLPCWV